MESKDWEILKTERDGTVHFSNISGKNIYAKVEIHDITTKTLQFSSEFNWDHKLDYFARPFLFHKDWGGDSVFKIINEEGKCILNHPYKFQGQRRLPVVCGEPIYFKSNKQDITYHTISEVFFDLIYQKDFCRVSTNDIIVDIGANIGIFSAFSQQMKPLHIFALEPMSETFSYLYDNLKKWDNTTLINKAISKDGEDMEFLIYSHSGSNILRDKVKDTKNGVKINEEKNIVNVKTITINNLIKNYNIPFINFLKVDCEGGEEDLFETIDKNYLKNNIEKIILEYHSSQIKSKILKILKNNHFVIEMVNDDDDLGMIYAYNPNLITLRKRFGGVK